MTPLYEGMNPFSSPTYIPTGDQDAGYNKTIFIQVTDIYGSLTTSNTYVIVSEVPRISFWYLLNDNKLLCNFVVILRY